MENGHFMVLTAPYMDTEYSCQAYRIAHTFLACCSQPFIEATNSLRKINQDDFSQEPREVSRDQLSKSSIRHRSPLNRRSNTGVRAIIAGVLVCTNIQAKAVSVFAKISALRLGNFAVSCAT